MRDTTRGEALSPRIITPQRRAAGTSAHTAAWRKSHESFRQVGAGTVTAGGRQRKRLSPACVELLAWAQAMAEHLNSAEVDLTPHQIAKQLCIALSTAKACLLMLTSLNLAEQIIQGSRQLCMASVWIVRPNGRSYATELGERSTMPKILTSTPRGKRSTTTKQAACTVVVPCLPALEVSWDPCVKALEELGEVKQGKLEAVFQATGLTPNETLQVIQAAGEQGQERGVENQVGYALRAIQEPEWREKLLAPPPVTPPVLSQDEPEVLREAAERIADQPRAVPIRNRGGFIASLVLSKPVDLLDVAKVVRQDRAALAKEVSTAPVALQGNPEVARLFGAWNRAVNNRPNSDSQGFLDHRDLEKAALRELIGKAESLLTRDQLGALRSSLGGRLLAHGLREGTSVWSMAWAHHWGVAVLSAFGIHQT